MTQPATRVHLPNARLLKCVWEDSGLRSIKGSRLLVLLALVQHTSRNADTMWPSIRRLSDFTRLSPRQVLRVLEDLERQGVIERDKRGRGRIYKMGAPIKTAAARIGDTRDTYAEAIGDTGDMRQVTPAPEIGDTGDTRSIKEEDSEVIRPREAPENGTEDALLVRCKALFRMRPATKLDRGEAKAWRTAAPLVTATSAQQWQVLEAYYGAELPARENYRRRDLAALLNNWNGELTRAADWAGKTGYTIPKAVQSVADDGRWRAALAALAAEKYPDADCSRFRRWEDLPASLQAEVLEVMAGAPADWQQLLRVYSLMNGDDPTRTFESWDRAPSYVRADLRTLAAEMAQSPAPEGWAAAITLLKEARELPAGDAYEAWPAVPLWLRAQVRLLMEKADEETETKGGTQHENTAD